MTVQKANFKLKAILLSSRTIWSEYRFKRMKRDADKDAIKKLYWIENSGMHGKN